MPRFSVVSVRPGSRPAYVAAVLGLAGLLLGLPAARPVPPADGGSAPLRILSITYGELVPVEELPFRREELIRRAFAEGRVRLERQYSDGRVETLSPTRVDLERALEGRRETAVVAVAHSADLSPLHRSAEVGDPDGDGFVGEEDGPPFLLGEYLGDVARITLGFSAQLEAGIVREKVETSETEVFSQVFSSNSRTTINKVSGSSEFRRTFGGSLTATLGNPLASIFQMITLSDPVFKVGVEYSRQTQWERAVTTELQERMEEHFQEKHSETVTVGPQAGFVRTQLEIRNVSHFPATMQITELVYQPIATDPRSGERLALGEDMVSGTITLASGERATRLLEYDEINTEQMERALFHGYMFDFDVSGGYPASTPDGSVDWKDQRSNVASRTAAFLVNFGDHVDPVLRHVAIEARHGGLSTVASGLAEIFGEQEVELGVDPGGRVIVTRIQHRENRFADRDFNDLPPEEQKQYGRWIVLYDFAELNTAPDLLLDSTPLHQGDQIGLYYVTKSDLVPPPPVPDTTSVFVLPLDGEIDNGGLLTVDKVSVGDTIEIDVDNFFELREQITRQYDRVLTWNCGLLVNATCYGTRVVSDHTLPRNIPNVDWYDFKLTSGTTNPRTWLSPSEADAEIVERTDFPDYSFDMRLTVTEELLNDERHGVLRIAQDHSDETLLRDCVGYYVDGRYADCTSRVWKDLRASQGTVRWFKYTPDQDIDGFAALYHYGTDWNDNDATVYPGAPERWDNKDNDQDGHRESVRISGPSYLRPGEFATFTPLVSFWTGETPRFRWSLRRLSSDGAFRRWQYLGYAPEIHESIRGGDDGFDLRVAATLEGRSLYWTLLVRRQDPLLCERRPGMICPE